MLAFLGDEPFEELLGGGPGAGFARQEHEPDAVLALGGQREGQHLAEEPVGDLQQDAGAVAGVGLAAARAAVPQVHQHLQRLVDDRVRALPLDVHDEADAARVVLVERIVEAGWCRRPGDGGHVANGYRVPGLRRKI